MATFDSLIKGGTIVDGTGAAPFTGDIGISDGTIQAVGTNLGSAAQTLDADGLLVTPGWIDIHTHYDAQVTWDPELVQSAWHGVSTVVLGNCGVGFAPAVPERHRWLINLMEGVEDIPGVSLEAGLDWQWESFPEYMDALDKLPRTVDVGTQMTHGALRAYVMGQRGADNETPTSDDLSAMAALIKEGMAAGALGFSTSRTPIHVDVDGVPVPGTFADEDELVALAQAVTDSGHGLLEMVMAGVAGEEPGALEREMTLANNVARRAGCPVMYLQVQHNADSQQWRQQLSICEQAAADGYRLIPQVAGRAIPILFSMAGEHPWKFMPSYAEIENLPPTERIAKMATPEMRARLLGEEDPNETGFSLLYKSPDLWDMTYPAGNPIDYTPPADMSIAQIAAREGRSPWEVAYDLMLEDEGHAMLMHTVTGYAERNADAVHEMLCHPLSAFGLSDAGAHCRFICDGGVHTYMLTHWHRDFGKDHPMHLPIEFVVKKLTGDNANLYGLADRGTLTVGRRADVNLIDLPNLGTEMPEMCYDLPAKQPRLVSRASGYVAGLVHGEIVQSNGELTGNRPGRVVRGG